MHFLMYEGGGWSVQMCKCRPKKTKKSSFDSLSCLLIEMSSLAGCRVTLGACCVQKARANEITTKKCENPTCV